MCTDAMTSGYIWSSLLILSSMECVWMKTLDSQYPSIRQCFPTSSEPGAHRVYLLAIGDGSRRLTARQRRTIDGWRIEEPMYITEPGWIILEEKDPDDIDPRIISREDPFYVARGKRSARQVQGGIKNKKMTTMNPIWEYLGRYGDQFSSRDKHSDILDSILKEPFFISRGKKSQFQKYGDTDDVDALDDSTMRNRRGKLVEQLLKEKDPFYITRGKKNLIGHKLMME